jgi:long-subunit fatty acid transport protein
MRAVAAVLASLLVSAPAFAGSITAPGVIAGPDSSAAVGNVGAIHWNPAAIATVKGVHTVIDANMMFVRVDATATRNGGIDPNTGEKYKVAQARVQVPVALIGATWQVVPDRLTLGVGLTDGFVGGADYSASEPEKPPYQGHQRYHAVTTKIITAQIRPAVGLTVVDGLHLGGTLGIQYNRLDALAASNILGTEGLSPGEVAAGTHDDPYSYDSVLSGSATGWTLGWSAGVFFDKFEKAQLGFAWDHAAPFHAEGEGAVDIPVALSVSGEPITVPAKVTFDQTMPDIARLFIHSKLNEKWTAGAGVEYQLWNVCCGDAEGDLTIGLTNKSGQAIGSADGVSTDISATQINPRRLWNSANFHLLSSVKPSDKSWLGIRLGYNQNAVPDYAVSPANLDFENVGVMLGGRYKVGGPFVVGLNYSKFFLFERNITTSAWNLQDGNAAFSPALPYKTSTNGTYSGAVDGVSVRLAMAFK